MALARGQALVPAEIIAKGISTADLLAHALVAKHLDHPPLYRLEAIFARAGLAIPRLMLEAGKGRTHRVYLWTYAAGVFEAGDIDLACRLSGLELGVGELVDLEVSLVPRRWGIGIEADRHEDGAVTGVASKSHACRPVLFPGKRFLALWNTVISALCCCTFIQHASPHHTAVPSRPKAHTSPAARCPADRRHARVEARERPHCHAVVGGSWKRRRSDGRELWLPVLAAMYSDTFRLTGIEKAPGGAWVHQAWQCEAGGSWRHDEYRAAQRDLMKPANKAICNES